jgi:hypothetical protein
VAATTPHTPAVRAYELTEQIVGARELIAKDLSVFRQDHAPTMTLVGLLAAGLSCACFGSSSSICLRYFVTALVVEVSAQSAVAFEA